MWRRRLVVGTVGVVALVASACSGSGSSDGAARSEPSTTAGTTTTTSPVTTPAPTTAAPITSGTSAVPAGVRVFARNPWYEPVPADAAPGPAGFTFGQELAREITQGYGHASLNTQRYAPVVYQVSLEQPTVAVQVWNCQNKASLDDGLIAQLAEVPIPVDAVIPADSDAHVSVWQPSTDTLWEMWKTRVVDGQWQACWGGRLTNVSESDGTFDFPYGATASGISLLAGLVTLSDIESGSIDHPLALGVGTTLAGTPSWPANRTDGRNDGANAIPEGQRLRLDPTLDLSTLNLTPLGRVIAEALQQYGAIVRDTTIGSVTIYAENPLRVMAGGQPDPYHALYAGVPKYAQLDGIPWDRLEALPRDYGKPG